MCYRLVHQRGFWEMVESLRGGALWEVLDHWAGPPKGTVELFVHVLQAHLLYSKLHCPGPFHQKTKQWGHLTMGWTIQTLELSEHFCFLSQWPQAHVAAMGN
jgi:hypothetical protein